MKRDFFVLLLAVLTKKLKIFLIIFITISNCFGQTYSSKSFLTFWLSKDYLNCLKTDLPCKCEKSSNLFLIAWSEDHVFLHYGSVNHRLYYDLKPDSQINIEKYYKVYIRHYSATLHKDSNILIGQIRLKNDTMLYIDSMKKQIIFYRSGVDNGYFNENIRLLNTALTVRGYNNINKLLQSDSLACLCDADGDINVIFDYSPLYKPRRWIIKLKKNVLYLYKWKNPQWRGKFNHKKKLLKKLKW